MRENLRKLILFAILILMVGVIVEFILICNKYLSAPPNLINEKEYNIEVGNRTEKFIIQTFSEVEGFSSYVIWKGLKNNQKLKLTGFEKDISFYQEKTESVDGNNLLVLYGDVGVHAQNIQIINITDDVIKTVHVDDVNKTDISTFTDVPKFIIENNLKTFAVDLRDYDKDPTLFSKRNYYKWLDSHFVFDRSEDISYNEE